MFAMFAGLPEPQKDILLRMQFQAQKWGYEQSYPDAEQMIVFADGRFAGDVLVHKVRRDLAVRRHLCYWRLIGTEAWGLA